MVDQLAANYSISITFVSVDGDPGYQSVFDREFEQLFPSNSRVPDLGLVLHVMQESQSRQIGDFVQFLKNARIRIDQKIVHCVAIQRAPGPR
jgi:hypothetical protein